MKRRQPKTSLQAWDSVKNTSMLSEHHLKILAALDEIKQGISETIALQCGLEKAAVYRRMDELEKLGLVKEIGVSKTSSGRNAALYELTAPAPRKEDIKENYFQPSLFS